MNESPALRPARVRRLGAAPLGLLILAACGTPAAGGAPQTATPSAVSDRSPATPAAPIGWSPFATDEFSVLAPGALAEVTSCPHPVVRTRSWIVDDRGVEPTRYAVVRMDFSAPFAQAMDRSKLDFLGELSLRGDARPTVSAPDRVRADGVDAQQYRLDFPDAVGALRALWIGDSLYLLAIVAPRSTTPPSPDSFFESFRVRPSTKRVRLEPPLAELEVPRAARAKTSSNDDTTLTDFFVDGREVCRVFDTAGAMPDKSAADAASRAIESLRRGGTISADHAVQSLDGTAGREADFLRRSNDVAERVRAFAAPAHFYLVTAPLDAHGALPPDSKRCLESFRMGAPEADARCQDERAAP